MRSRFDTSVKTRKAGGNFFGFGGVGGVVGRPVEIAGVFRELAKELAG
jgi:hypothetical protein